MSLLRIAARRTLALARPRWHGAAMMSTKVPQVPHAVGDEIPVSFMKSEDNPKVMADDAYPAWLWDTTNLTPLSKLNERIADHGLGSLELHELRRWRKLSARNSIKAANLASKK